MCLMAYDMEWQQVASAELGIIIISGPDCLHCIELQAQLSEKPLKVPFHWTNRNDGAEILEKYPLFAAAIDVLPFAGIFSHGKGIEIIRAASRERIEEVLSEL